MKKTLFSLAAASIIILQGFFAAPALAQYYQPGSYYPYPGQPYSQYPYGSSMYCPQLSYNLVLGSSDYYTAGQVSELQRYLETRYWGVQVTGYFDQNTYNAVAQFQRQYAVYPITGGVGPLTRAAIARTCGGYPYPYPYPTAPVLTGISGPTQLAVGQGAEWQVSVRDYSGRLTYSATWGDEGTYGYAGVSPLTTTGSLSHTYLRPGTYTPRFTATNAYGQSVSGSITVVVTGGCNYYYPWTCQNQPYYPYPYGY